MGAEWRQSEAGLAYCVLRPERADGGLVIALHGRGSSPEVLESAAEKIFDRGACVLPRGPYFWERGHAWYLPEQRSEGIATSRQALLSLWAELRRDLGVGPELTAVWGFSQGGVLALELGLASPSPFAAVVSVAGKLDALARGDEALLARASGREFLLVHGVRDEVLPHQASRDAYVALAARGAKVELAELPTGHALTDVVCGAVRGFIASCLGPARPIARA